MKITFRLYFVLEKKLRHAKNEQILFILVGWKKSVAQQSARKKQILKQSNMSAPLSDTILG